MIDQGYVIALAPGEGGDPKLARGLGINANTVLVFLDRESADTYLEQLKREEPQAYGAFAVHSVVVLDGATYHRAQWHIS